MRYLATTKRTTKLKNSNKARETHFSTKNMGSPRENNNKFGLTVGIHTPTCEVGPEPICPQK